MAKSSILKHGSLFAFRFDLTSSTKKGRHVRPMHRWTFCVSHEARLSRSSVGWDVSRRCRGGLVSAGIIKLRNRSDPNRRWNRQVFSVLSGFSFNLKIPGCSDLHQSSFPENTTTSECLSDLKSPVTAFHALQLDRSGRNFPFRWLYPAIHSRSRRMS